jgi:hypothetical protein
MELLTISPRASEVMYEVRRHIGWCLVEVKRYCSALLGFGSRVLCAASFVLTVVCRLLTVACEVLDTGSQILVGGSRLLSDGYPRPDDPH